jgi:hypothetical protein
MLIKQREDFGHKEFDLKTELEKQKQEIEYYIEFNKYERQELHSKTQDLELEIQREREKRDETIAKLEAEKNERMEKMRREMLLEVKQVKTDMLNFTDDKLQGNTR